MILEYVKMSDQRNNETQGRLQSSLEGLTQLLKMKIEQDQNKWSVRSLYWLNYICRFMNEEDLINTHCLCYIVLDHFPF